MTPINELMAKREEDFRDANDAFDRMVEECHGVVSRHKGTAERLDAALNRIAAKWQAEQDAKDISDHPTIKYWDRPEDMEPEAAESGVA